MPAAVKSDKFAHLKLARDKLNPNNLEAGLPGREEQCDDIHQFLFERLKIRNSNNSRNPTIASHDNKTIFICGVPGTGKTASVEHVIKKLETLASKKSSQINKFKAVYANGAKLPRPDRVYSEILLQITGQQKSPQRAKDELENLFIQSPKSTKDKKFYIVVVDELDLLYTEKRQSVFYNLFDWPTSSNSGLILIAIANALDLPERLMKGRIASRVGCNKFCFDTYNVNHLENIIKVRLGPKLLDQCFEARAIKLAACRIGRVIGDARRMLDTCRLAIDQAIKEQVDKVSCKMINDIGFQKLDNQVCNYVKSCPALDLLMLKSILTETEKLGEDNVRCWDVYKQLVCMMDKDKFFTDYKLSPDTFDVVITNLRRMGFIYLEPGKDTFEARTFIKYSRDSFKDLIRTQQAKTRLD